MPIRANQPPSSRSRRARRPAQERPGSAGTNGLLQQLRSLPRHWPRVRRGAVTAAVWGSGALLGAGLLGLIWPQGSRESAAGESGVEELGKPPTRGVTVLVIGVDSDRLRDPSNRAAPAGAANADALLLLRVNPSAPLQVLQLPVSVAVQLPGKKRPQSLASLYRSGGPALMADAVRELAGLPSGQPDRYVVISRAGLRTLVNGLGTVEANPRRTMRYTDRSQAFSVDLQSGLQRLKAGQVEQLARWRDPKQPLESRLANHQELSRGLQRQLSEMQPQINMPTLLGQLQTEVETNLSRTEALGLLAAGLRPGMTPNFSILPLEPRPGNGSPSGREELRERLAALPDRFWAEPPISKP
ncbi:MAG: LCP family protein [Cyanobium sp.]|nr:LCP family protein [Cyanobium sp.]